MPKHTENCQFSEYYAEFVIKASPDILWYDIQDVGSYQGSIYGVGKYKKQIVIYEDGYGSCSGCGEWVEANEWSLAGAQPHNQEEVLNKSKLFATKEEAKQYVLAMDFYEKPDTERMIKAIEEIKL
jgi:hypothetical protein